MCLFFNTKKSIITYYDPNTVVQIYVKEIPAKMVEYAIQVVADLQFAYHYT